MIAARTGPERAPFAKGWLLLLAFAVGLVYLLILPPWQQNDEPSQFEYVWLAAHLDHWPKPGDVDAKMRREVMTSMLEHGFYRNAVRPPNLTVLKDPVNIGQPQLDGMPLYYFLASLPVRLFPNADVTLQMYLARLVSLALFVATVFFAIQTTDLVFGSRLIGWMIAAFVALLPQLAYRMTAVNDDASAIAAMTFFIWMCARGLQCGPDRKTLLGIPLGMALCFLSKTTAWMALPFGALALVLILFRGRERLVWAGVVGVAVLAAVLAFDWRATLPADFYQFGGNPRRAQTTKAVDGKFAFTTDRQHNGFYHILDKAALTAATRETNRMVTVGVWAWANKPVEVPFVMLQFNGKHVIKAGKTRFTTQPVFLSGQVQIPEKYEAPYLRLLSKDIPAGAQIYWDCFVMVPGERSVQKPPQTRSGCAQADWDGYSGANFIRNPSAEQGWLPLRQKMAGFVSRKYGLQSADLWAVIFDPVTSGPYLREGPTKIFRTFWGRFNWGTLALAGQHPYRLFVALSGLALLGLPLALWRYRKQIRWNLLVFVLALLGADLVYTLARFLGGWNEYYAFLPQARYFFPVILPTALVICAGWYALLDVPLKKMRLADKFIYIFIGLFLLYNGWAWYTIWTYWHAA